jgi:hypothetical protein
MLTKVCKICGLEKPLSDFSKSSTNKYGVATKCKECCNWKHRSDESKKKELEWRELFDKGLKKCACCGKKLPLEDFPLRKSSRDGRKSYCIVCYREKALVVSRKPETIEKKKERESTREFLDNLRVYRQTSEVYQTNLAKYRETPQYKQYQKEYNSREDRKLRHNLSTRVWAGLTTQDTVKQHEFDEYSGCTFHELKIYIESLWTMGMSWDNYGRGKNKWHVDHIIPCAYFNLKDDKEEKRCFHYSNLQPLWEPENLRKNSKYKGVRVFHKKAS